MDGTVYALAVNGGELYAGGSFTNAGGVAANRIAKWNGSAWSALGSGMDGTVYALAFFGTLYAGGSFPTADGVLVNNIAKWSGSWTPMTNPGPDARFPGVMNGSVSALAALNSGLGVAGSFTSAGGSLNTYSIAKWGFGWSPIDNGLGGNVAALASSGNNVYFGGTFQITRNLSTYKNIARWDGSSWDGLIYWKYAPNGSVNALAMDGTDLYVGGDFTTAALMTLNHIFRISDTTREMSNLGSGVNGAVQALAADGAGRLFVGGDFTIAGTSVCNRIAQANLAGAISGGTLAGPVFISGAGFSCTFSNGTMGKAYRIQSCPALGSGTWTDVTNFTYSGPVRFTDGNNSGTNCFYRAISP
jgi:hypothetical protein